MTVSALFSTICIILICVYDVAHNGIGGFSIIGIRRVFTDVVFVFGGKLLDLLNLVRTAFALFLTVIQWPVIPIVSNLNPKNFPYICVSFLFH